MLTKIQYKSETERAEILRQNSDKFLVEEQNITEGNFLIFSDTLPAFQIMTTVPLEEFEKLKQNQELMQVALDELILGGAS